MMHIAVPLLPSPAVRAVPASVFLHIITIRRQAVCKHDAAFAIGLFVQIVPLSVHKYPAAFHAGLRINIEPAAINAVADPSGHCVAILVESPPVSIDKNPLICNSNCIGAFMFFYYSKIQPVHRLSLPDYCLGRSQQPDLWLISSLVLLRTE